MFGVHVSPGSSEKLIRRGWVTNRHLIAYSLSNISAKNYYNRLMCVEVIVCYISVVMCIATTELLAQRHKTDLSVTMAHKH